MPAHKWCRYAHTTPVRISLTDQCEANDLKNPNVRGDSRLSSNSASRKGISRNSAAPLTRCRIDTTPGSGRRIWIRLRYFGRGLDIDRCVSRRAPGDHSVHPVPAMVSCQLTVEILAV